MKKKILWMIDGLGHGGAERMTLAIMQKFDRSEFDLRACALQVKQGNPVAAELERLGIPVDLLHIPNLRHPRNLPKIIRYVKEHKPDIIHTQLEFANVFGNIAAAILGIPSVATLHTLGAPQKGTEYWRSQIEWASLRYFCTRVISVSESASRHHIKYGNIPPKKMVTLYNGIELENFDPKHKHGSDIRASLGIPNDSFVMLTVAVLREPKGIQFMIEAMPQIVAGAPNAHYLIVGEGDHGEKLRELSRSLGVEKHITFAGQRNDIPDVLAAGDLFVLPTLIDALPTVLIEAMAARKAIVASNVGGVPEIVEHEKNGILVEPGKPHQLVEGCLRLIRQNEVREAMAEAGFQIAHSKFNIENQVRTISNMYEELIKHGR